MPDRIQLARRGLQLIAAAALLTLGACDRLGPTPQPSLAERKAAADRLEFWSIEAVGTKAPPVQICTDVAMRMGFVRPSPSIGGAPCVRLNRPVERPGLYAFRCQTTGREWAVVSSWRGDLERDFTASQSVSSLDAPRDMYAQEHRFRRLGPCPSGWVAGQGLDHNGRPVMTLVPWPVEASPPP